MTHDLKIAPQYFHDVVAELKTFEVRYNDRNYKTGDKLLLKEYDYRYDSYTGNYVIATIMYILDDPKYCKEGYVIMSIYVNERYIIS